MTHRVLMVAVSLAMCGVSQATIVGFGQLGGSNATVPKTLASRATADGPGFVVSNGTTPSIVVAWDVNGERNNGNPNSNGWDIHTSDRFTALENLTIGGGAWDNEGDTRRIGQLDFGLHTIGFSVDFGAQLVLNSFDFAHTDETPGTTSWNLELTDSASNVAWSQTIDFTNGMAINVSPNFTGLPGEDYILTFSRTSSSYNSDGRHGIDNLSFNQVPDLSNPVGALVIDRSTGSAYIRADQAFSFSEYAIESPVGALNSDGWASITATGADPADDWSIQSATSTLLHEKDGPLGPNNGIALTAGGQLSLGQAFSILPTFRRDGTTPTNWENAGLGIFDSNGTPLAVLPEYTGNPVGWGDYNGDGTVSILDWPLFRAGYSGNYAGMSAAEAYLGGDLDGDFDSDIHDFNIFVELAGGMGALFGATPVPEPSSVLLIALGGVVVWARRRVRGLAVLLGAVAAVTLGTTAKAQSVPALQNFSVVGSTPTTSLPEGQTIDTPNSGPEQFFDDTYLDTPGVIGNLLFDVDYVADFEPGTYLQYAIGGGTPGAADTAVVFMDYGSPVTASWFAYAQRTGGNPLADKVGKFEFWFSNTDFAGTLPATGPNAVLQLLPGDNRINDSVIRPYTLSGEHTGQYVAMRITETAASGALTSTSRIGGHEFRLLDGPSDVVLTVDRETGELTLRNNLGGAENIFLTSYTIESPGGALVASGFDGVRGDAMFTPGNGSGNGWELAQGLNPNRVAEAYFNNGGVDTVFAAGTSDISLGNAYNTLSRLEDLVFLWTNTAGQVYNARVEYIGVAPGIVGDYNDDGVVNLADYTVWRDNLGASITLPNDSTPGTVTDADYSVWKSNFGAGSPLVGGLGSATVPEPSSLLVLVPAVAGLIAGRRIRSKFTKT